jgi:hypothetical protein
VSAFCADSITDDRAAWRICMRRIAGLVRPGGTLLVAALHRATWSEVGGRLDPSANIDVNHLRLVQEPAFNRGDGAIEVRHVPEHDRQGYRGIILAAARRCRRARLHGIAA